MKEYYKPNIVISKCIEFANCRWNGEIIHSKFVENIKSYVNFFPVCPEFEIGLGIPRKPIRLVKAKENIHLVQFETNIDLTKEMNNFSQSFLNNLKDIDGFILKNRSPSCGIKDVKLYASMEKQAPVDTKQSGLFGSSVFEKFNQFAIENEGRLLNFYIREHFLSKIYIHSSFRELKKNFSVNNFIKFHTKNKLLYMAYKQSNLYKLGRIVANIKNENQINAIREYEELLNNTFNNIPRYSSIINVLMHALGYFSKKLNSKEKAFFLDMLEKYRNKKASLSECTAVIKTWIIHYDEEYLAGQTFFAPFPEELTELTNSGN